MSFAGKSGAPTRIRTWAAGLRRPSCVRRSGRGGPPGIRTPMDGLRARYSAVELAAHKSGGAPGPRTLCQEVKSLLLVRMSLRPSGSSPETRTQRDSFVGAVCALHSSCNLVDPDGIDPSSAVLQTAANPSQLEVRNLERYEGIEPCSARLGRPATRPACCSAWLPRLASNQWPLDYRSSALPSELQGNWRTWRGSNPLGTGLKAQVRGHFAFTFSFQTGAPSRIRTCIREVRSLSSIRRPGLGGRRWTRTTAGFPTSWISNPDRPPAGSSSMAEHSGLEPDTSRLTTEHRHQGNLCSKICAVSPAVTGWAFIGAIRSTRPVVLLVLVET